MLVPAKCDRVWFLDQTWFKMCSFVKNLNISFYDSLPKKCVVFQQFVGVHVASSLLTQHSLTDDRNRDNHNVSLTCGPILLVFVKCNGVFFRSNLAQKGVVLQNRNLKVKFSDSFANIHVVLQKGIVL